MVPDSFQTIKSSYRRENRHIEIKVLKNKIGNLTEKKEALENEITRRENFVKILTKCKNRIAKYITVA